MKHFVAIIAHKNTSAIISLCSILEEMGFPFLIHLDKKASHLRAELKGLQSHIIPESIAVYRGHFSIVEASLILMKHSLAYEYDYFHLISGEDLPVKPADAFRDFFTQNSGFSFMNYNLLPVINSAGKREDQREQLFSSYSVFLDRIPIAHYQHRFFRDGMGLIDMRHFRENSFASRLVHKGLRYYTFQDLYAYLFRKKIPDIPYYAGSAWFSVKRELIIFFTALNAKNPSAFTMFRHAAFPDEIVFQTLVMNSEFSETIINSDLRFIQWSEPNGQPAILDETCFSQIAQSNGFFARKWDLSRAGIIDYLKKTLIHV